MDVRPDNAWGQSHAGYKRTSNEDRFLIRRLPGSQAVVLAVADGMGGEAGGDIAAQIAIDAIEQSQIPRHATEQDLTRILNLAGKQIMQKAEDKPGLLDMGTTTTVALVRDKTAYWSHAGDSRLYRFRTGFLEQISTDHTFVEDLVAEGTLSREEADRHPLRNMLDQCVGCANLKAESGRFALIPGDRLLLCSDGLTRHLSDRHIQTALESGTPRQTVAVLIDQALSAGGKDNVTVVIMDIGA
jgi:serine/threonine protein phosphatase PrpC